MPNRPNRYVSLFPEYNPQLIQDELEREFLPVQSASVLATAGTLNEMPATNFHNAGAGSQYYALFRFDLRDLYAATLTLHKAMMMWGGGISAIGTLVLGRIKDADQTAWTSAATYNTKDGAVAWTGGAGGFRQAGTEVSFTLGAMPGVTGGVNFINATQGDWPLNAGFYHPRYDPNLDDPTLATIASFLMNCLTVGNGFVNLYMYKSTTGANGADAGSLTDQFMERIRLVVWEMDFGVAGSYGPADAGMIRWPPHELFEAASPSNAGALGYSVFNMTTVNDRDVTVRGYNYHGGISGGTLTHYLLDTIVGTGASVSYVLMEFDLMEFMGKTFEKVLLRVTGGADGTGTGVGGQLHVAQFKDPWIIGDGGLASSTFGPTYNHQNKMGSVAWPSGAPGAAGAIDTVGQAETVFTTPSSPQWGGTTNSAAAHTAEVDITAMANRALSTYGAKLRLRLRMTHTGGATVPANRLQGPAVVAVTSRTVCRHNDEINGNLAVGYQGWPRLLIATV